MVLVGASEAWGEEEPCLHTWGNLQEGNGVASGCPVASSCGVVLLVPLGGVA